MTARAAPACRVALVALAAGVYWAAAPAPRGQAAGVPPLATDAPALDALAFGVPRPVALANRSLADRHRQWVYANMVGDVRTRWNERQSHAWTCWELLSDALDFGTDPNVRASRLRCLRERIGELDYAAGVLPSAVPEYGPSGPPLGLPK